MERTIAWILACMLCACMPRTDDPANPPRLGRWHDATMPISVTVDDRGVPDAQLPAALRDRIAALTKTEETCGEPYLRRREEVERFLNQRLRGCRVITLDRDGPAVSGLARCEAMDLGGGPVVPASRFEGMVGSDRLSLDIRSILRVPEATGGAHMVVIALRRTLRRIGDC